MPTVFKDLLETDEDGYTHLQEWCQALFLDGECYAFAIALHQGLGWPMVGLVNREDVIRHVAIRTPESSYLDARGRVSKDELGAPFGPIKNFRLKMVTKTELTATRPVHDLVVHRARQMAEVLWPELPWRNSLSQQIVQFADELESLCRKHGIWIRAPFPASQPQLALSEGDEAGYIVSRTSDGTGYMIDRRL